MIRSAGNRPYAPNASPRRPRTAVQAGGGVPIAASPTTPAQVTGVSVLQQVVSAFMVALSRLVGWLRGLFQNPAQPTVVGQPMGPLPAGQPATPPSGNPVDAPFVPLPGMTLQQGGVSAGVGLTQVGAQPAVGGKVEARTGDTLVTGAAAVTRTSDGLAATAGARVVTPTLTADAAVRADARGISGQANVAGTVGDARVLGTVAANPEGAAGVLTVAGPRVQGAVAGVVTKDTQLVAGQVAARVGEDGVLRAAGLYQNGPQGLRANAMAAYHDRTTEAGVRYDQENDRHSVGGYVDKALPHSSLSLGGDYLWSPDGTGGRAYGRWQSDAIGEQVGGFTVKGALEAGAVKLPGQDWATYAAGRVTAEKANAALFAEINHQAGPGFAQPDTTLKFGAQFRF